MFTTYLPGFANFAEGGRGWIFWGNVRDNYWNLAEALYC